MDGFYFIVSTLVGVYGHNFEFTLRLDQLEAIITGLEMSTTGNYLIHC